jgi:hypothetical protein
METRSMSRFLDVFFGVWFFITFGSLVVAFGLSLLAQVLSWFVPLPFVWDPLHWVLLLFGMLSAIVAYFQVKLENLERKIWENQHLP